MISAKINVSAINKEKLFKGQKGTYLDLVLLENKDGVDQYGNNGMVVQGVSKEERLAGERGVILGNYRVVQTKAAATPTSSTPIAEDDIPF